MTIDALLEKAGRRPDDLALLAELAREALAGGEEERALPALETSAAALADGGLWQWKALLERSLDRHSDALQSFAEAARLRPDDPGIAHGLARVSLEAGVDARSAYERAQRLAPSDGAVALGLAAARLAAGDGQEAETALDALVARSPLWIEGHVQLAQLRSMLGRPEDAARSLERAIAGEPGQGPLWQALFDLHIRANEFDTLAESIERAGAAGISAGSLLPFRAIAAAELGKTEQADEHFARLATDKGPLLPIWEIRHLLRSGRPGEALPIIDSMLGTARAPEAWPYAAAVWRMVGDKRAEWLIRGTKFISEFDLTERLPPLDRLAEHLRSLHLAKGQYLDQSVRGGTQTDGPLFSRIDPEIRQLRGAIVGAVEAFVAGLPPPDPEHPLLAPRRDRRVRFAGSWSVRLRGGGHHVSHVHPQGWISSALYVDVPDRTDSGNPEAGWLAVGEPPPTLQTGLAPLTTIEPKPGHLLLFPSWMWHGTRPFPEGERLTVAFDVCPPT